MYLPLGRDVSHIFDLAAAFAVSGCKKRKNVDLAIGGAAAGGEVDGKFLAGVLRKTGGCSE